MIEHPFAPVYNARSRILILGSFPSVRSREVGFFYGHERNRFWRVLATVLNEPLPGSIPEKKEMLLRRGVALWDAAGECEITGSSDASMKQVKPNDFAPIFEAARIRAVFCNGATAHRIYQQYSAALFGEAIRLPSTSPANAACDYETLCAAWERIGEFL